MPTPPYTPVRRYASISIKAGCLLYAIYALVKLILFKRWSKAEFWTSCFVGYGVYVSYGAKAARRRFLNACLMAKQPAVLELRRVVADVEAHTTTPMNSWKGYFRRHRRWIRTSLPRKPAAAEVEMALKECEDAVGPSDVNMLRAVNQLLFDACAQKDLELQKPVLERYIPLLEQARGKDSEALIRPLARLGHLHFTEAEYETSAGELHRAVQLQNLHLKKNPRCKALINDIQFMFHRKLLGLAYTMAKDYDAAEAVLVELLPGLEATEVVLSPDPLGPQMVRGSLIRIFVMKGWKALNDVQDGGQVAIRYLRDALVLTAVHPSLLAHNIKSVGRLFIRAGRIEDGSMAFRLGNAAYEAGKRSGKPQRNCFLCTPGADEVETHGFRKCDGCSKKINLGDEWYFCRTCEDVDLCPECYAGPDKDAKCKREELENFPRNKLGHEFFEVRGDDMEENISAHVWLANVTRRLTVELKDDNMGREEWVLLSSPYGEETIG